MEENRAQLRRSSQRIIAVIYILVVGFAIGVYFLINYLEQDGIVNDTQTERGWAALALFFVWTILCYRLFRINTRVFDQRSQIFDAREEKHHIIKTEAMLREQFMANMSHEIRTPLNAIIGFGNLLLRGDLKERDRELASNIQLASENLLAIVNDILDFSKIEAGMLVLENIPFDPDGLFHSMQQLFSEKARQKNLSLDVHLAPGLPQQLAGDPTRLTQILVNLIGNALKFTERGGVVVSVVPISQSHGMDDSHRLTLRIEVRDSGIGIPEDQLERVFERFTQSDEQTTRIYGGTGLGLSIVKGLVRAMQGSISVQSDPGKGSIFTVLLPFDLKTGNTPAVSKPANQPSNRPSPELHNMHLLVAEDNPMNRRVVELLFEDWKIKYTMTNNGREAVEMLAQAPATFDLVLMDIQMPEMDGYAATQQIRHKLNLNIPIVAMTAHALAGERQKCLDFGMNDYIAKPIREQELRHILARFSKNKADAAAPEMDRAYLHETTLGKIDYQRELAQIFLTQVPKDLDAIASALSTANLSIAAKAAHNMKSTVGYMGFAQNIGQQLSAFEQACGDGEDLSALFRDLAEIREKVEMAKAQVQREYVE